MSDSTPKAAPLKFLAGGGEMGERIRAFDWAATPIGAPETWSPALRTMVSILLANRFPQLLWWGPQYIQMYNDPYIPIPGAKHPRQAFGKPASECWSEIWHVIGPLVDTPFRGGPATWMEDILLEINRHGFLEESHFTIAYSAVPDETAPNGIGGVLATVHEITEKVVGERRVVALHDLTRVIETQSADEVCRHTAAALGAHDRDVPFALLYLIEPGTRQARLAGAHGVRAGEPLSPRVVDLAAPSDGGWPLAEVERSEKAQILTDLGARFGTVPQGPWSDPPHTAVVLPIRSNRSHEPAGLLVAGISARLAFDSLYQSFLDLLAAQIATAIANARAYEEEKRRAEALTELDRAKTAFFSNVSHEFRTPLTLMLGPLEETLAGVHGALPPDAQASLAISHRNSLRLLRLVNTLLDFSRIEAGRVRARYQEADLAALTAELASNFRSACDKAGLRLIVRCPALPRPTFVDRDMWEKIVLNLISNAFKFTLEGEIEVRLESVADRARLTVRDTGVGIPPAELPRMFERFHRIQDSRGRTHEGTGIGLALVEELVKLHGGAVSVESDLGIGSSFHVTLPFGADHLDPERVGGAGAPPSDAQAAAAYVQEALRWLPGEHDPEVIWDEPAPTSGVEPGGPRSRILWADDNADMRAYVSRLLGPRYDVEAVADGQAALEAALDRPPDLVLTDVMMPRLDGFGLLRALRSNPRTTEIPVIFLSARAGEESRIEGMGAGADDYLVKPFSSRELIARVGAHLKLARVRREALESLAEAARRKDEFLAILAHELRNPLGPVRNAAHYLSQKELPDPELRRPLEMIERQVDQMARLIDDLLDVSRLTRGMLELRPERLDFVEVAEATIDACRDEITSRGHTVHVRLPEKRVTLNADRQRLVQVFGNLIGNAVKYTPPGGRIDLAAEVADTDTLEVSVTDNGVGIPPGKLEEIFELFAQVDRSLERQGGLGIGLTLARQLVALHGGTLEAKSAGIGYGSTFTVRLPIAAWTATEGAASTTRARERARPRRILVVDDNQDAVESMALLLGTDGHTVRVAFDGESALASAQEFQPEVVFLDIGMPRMDGHQVARRMRAAPWGRSVHLVALTGWGQESDRQRSEEAGFDTHLVKPVSYDMLTSLLRNLESQPQPSP